MSDKTLGQVAFEAYCEAVGGKTFDGKPIPGWDELHGDRAKVQSGWEAAAEAIRQHMRMIHALDETAGQGNMRLMGRDFREQRETHWRPVGHIDLNGPLPDPEPSLPPVGDRRAALAHQSMPDHVAEPDDDVEWREDRA